MTLTIADELDVLVANQQRTIRLYVWFGTILVVMGMIVVTGALLFGERIGSEPIKTGLSIGGALISTVSVFPLKEVNGCRDRLSLYRMLKTEVTSAESANRGKIESLVWEALKKVALG